mgnify:FL=1
MKQVKLLPLLDHVPGHLFLFNCIMKKLIDQINKVLINWDPIGVGADIAETEYIDYIPQIIKNATDESQLMVYLEQMLLNDMGLSYNKRNLVQYKTMQTVCTEIIHICKSVDFKKM